MSTPKDHAKYAASSSERWVNCPSSVIRSESAPPQTTSMAAEEGTNAHYLMEYCLKNNVKDVHSLFKKGGTFSKKSMQDKYDLEMRDNVQGFIGYVRSLLSKGHELLIESRVNLKFLHPTDAFGTVDVAIVEPFGVLHVIDFKYGRGFVDHKDNSQMIYYALGIAHRYKYDFEAIKTTIYQPRTGSSEVHRTDTFSIEKLRTWSKAFKKAISICETATEDSHLKVGDWCKFCPAKIDCPSISTALFKKASLDFSDKIQPSASELTSDQLKKLLDRAAYLELWIKEIKSYAEDRIRNGHKIRGWMLAPTKPSRVWRDADKLLNNKIYGPVLKKNSDLISPAQAEKVLKKVLTKKELAKFLEANVVSISSGDKLVPNETLIDYDIDYLD